MSKVAAFVLENVNGVAFVAGAVWLYLGVAGYSPHAANVLLGAILMTIGVLPYLLRRKRKP